MDSRRHLSHGHYRVSDKEAGALAREVGASLPKIGYELRVEVDGRAMYLTRTPLSATTAAAYRMSAPKRGWVWAVY